MSLTKKIIAATFFTLTSSIAIAAPFTPTQINDAVYVSLAQEVATVKQALDEELQVTVTCEVKTLRDNSNFSRQSTPVLLALAAKDTQQKAAE